MTSCPLWMATGATSNMVAMLTRMPSRKRASWEYCRWDPGAKTFETNSRK